MTEKELLELKQKIDKAKESLLKLKGQKEGLLQQLSTSFNCKNIKEAKKLYDSMVEEKNALSEKIQEGMREIENALSDESE